MSSVYEKNYNELVFTGSDKFCDSGRFIRNLEEFFQVNNTPEFMKIFYFEHFLSDEAEIWFDHIKIILRHVDLSYEFVKSIFLETFSIKAQQETRHNFQIDSRTEELLPNEQSAYKSINCVSQILPETAVPFIFPDNVSKTDTPAAEIFEPAKGNTSGSSADLKLPSDASSPSDKSQDAKADSELAGGCHITSNVSSIFIENLPDNSLNLFVNDAANGEILNFVVNSNDKNESRGLKSNDIFKTECNLNISNGEISNTSLQNEALNLKCISLNVETSENYDTSERNALKFKNLLDSDISTKKSHKVKFLDKSQNCSKTRTNSIDKAFSVNIDKLNLNSNVDKDSSDNECNLNFNCNESDNVSDSKLDYASTRKIRIKSSSNRDIDNAFYSEKIENATLDNGTQRKCKMHKVCKNVNSPIVARLKLKNTLKRKIDSHGIPKNGNMPLLIDARKSRVSAKLKSVNVLNRNSKYFCSRNSQFFRNLFKSTNDCHLIKYRNVMPAG